MAIDSELRTGLEPVLAALWQQEVIFFPIRHHSPACAWHIQQLIRSHKPAAVLIEGPADMTELIPFILHPQTKMPFAVYTTFVDTTPINLGDRSASPSPTAAELPGLNSHRFAGYYPFCDYSPELVALRTGAEVGAQLQFIDLTFSGQILAADRLTPESVTQIRALQEENYLKRSAYLTALAKKTGCRDQDDLWDHLFEANFLTVPTPQFMQNVAAYCWMARQDTQPETLEADGTIAREQAMAAAIQTVRQQIAGKILVITGGFHTVVLPLLVQQPTTHPAVQTSNIKTRTSKTAPAKIPPTQAQTVLMRYSFDQLDALNGYAAGMPAPEFYQRLWLQTQTGNTNPALATANQLLVEIGKQTRQQKVGHALSTADAIAALEQARRLATFRHHATLTREDLLDGIRSCFVKGAMDGEGAILMGLVRQMLTGNRIGDLPADVGVPPIVEDFRQLAIRLRLKIKTSLPQSLTLDIYRKAAHRQASRLLHTLQFLDIPFGRVVSGPDFVQGYRLDRIQEIWEYRWLPQTESALIERSLYGATVEEAAINRLQEAIAQLEDAGEGRSATAAVRMLVTACRMGLHGYSDRLLDLIAAHLGEDAAFVSLVEALNQLVLLWQSREPLEAHALTQIPTLISGAYQRACYLLPELANSPPEAANAGLDALCIVREVLQVRQESPIDQNQDLPLPLLDADLFHASLTQLLSQTQGSAVVLGGAAGLLYQAGLLEEQRLVDWVVGYLNSTAIDPTIGAGFLRGLLRSCREISWQVTALLEAIDVQLATWSDDEFLRALPEFRLAFADLTPRETDQVAEQVAGLHGKLDLGDLSHRQLTEADLQLGLRLNQRVGACLEQDHLQHWLNQG